MSDFAIESSTGETRISMGKQSRKKASKPPRAGAAGPRATPLDLAGALAPFEFDLLPRKDVFHPPEHMLDGLLGVIAMRREKGAKELSDELDVSWGACAETLLALLGDADAYAREKFVGRALAPFYAVAALERLVGRSGAVAQTAAETERLLALSVAEPAWDEEYRDAFGEPFGARVADLFARVARGEDSVFDAARRVLARLPPLLDGAAYRTKRARDPQLTYKLRCDSIRNNLISLTSTSRKKRNARYPKKNVTKTF